MRDTEYLLIACLDNIDNIFQLTLNIRRRLELEMIGIKGWFCG